MTLLPIIKRECESHSDKWPAYRSLLGAEGFSHSTVNHQDHYFDPNIGAHTQAVERSWLDVKISILRKKRGVPSTYGQLSHNLDGICDNDHVFR